MSIRSLLLLLGLFFVATPASAEDDWTTTELRTIRSLWIGSLPPLPASPSNRAADHPIAQKLGHELFFDTRLSANGKVSCGTCHLPERAFTDGLALGRGIGTAGRNTMTVIGGAYSPWMFWDGRKDSLWSQALGPIESPVEHGITRADAVAVIKGDADYRNSYGLLFGPLPAGKTSTDEIFANMGKAIEAYERLLVPGPSRFDQFAEALLTKAPATANKILNGGETAGLRLFVSKRARCTRCHNGPLFSNYGFHNTGVPGPSDDWSDRGRAAGIAQVRIDPFNCTGQFSDAGLNACQELRFAKSGGPHELHSFKTPTLRNVSKTEPYMHAGQFGSLEHVIAHYNDAPKPKSGRSELVPLNLSVIERRQLVAFLRSLDSPVAAAPHWLRAP